MISKFHLSSLSAGVAMAAPIVLILTGSAMSSSLLLTKKQTCTTTNCNAFEIKGALSGTGTNISNPRSVPWVAQVAGDANTCLRFDVTESAGVQFLEMTVLSPNNGVRTGGTILNEPDKDCCPKVVVATVPNPGFYTVIINNNGGDPTQATFTLKYQAYDKGNKNCKPVSHQF